MTIRTDIGARLAEGRSLAREKYKKQDAEKLGILRAGNSGLMSASGDVAGSCHRIAHLRQLGIEVDPPTDNNLIMFQVGTANEDLVYNDLLHTAGENEIILREEEIPTEWTTSNGTSVTGRPDMVICRREVDEKRGVVTVPVLGLELKSVASVWTSRSVLFEGEPKLSHLVQAGHYMWQLGSIPFRLIYKQYALQAMPEFAHRYMPKQGRANSQYIEYNEKGEPKSVKPFELVYELEYKDGRLRYRVEGMTKWTNTIVYSEDIRRYYEYVSTMGPEQKLGPKPLTVDPQGEEKSYSNCKYCPLNEVCKQKRLSYSDWLDQVKQELFQSGAQKGINPDWKRK